MHNQGGQKNNFQCSRANSYKFYKDIFMKKASKVNKIWASRARLEDFAGHILPADCMLGMPDFQNDNTKV